VACPSPAPLSRDSLPVIHRPSLASQQQTMEKTFCAMHNCRRLGR
jgi:hypothetical protein